MFLSSAVVHFYKMNLYNLITKVKTWTPLFTSVRCFERKPYIRRYGYKEKILIRGTLPRTDSKIKLPMPTYEPKNVWCEKRALFGQNDYIDILGNGNMHPVRLLTNVPYWLRGFRGNEYQMLLRKRTFLGHRLYQRDLKKHNELQKRIKYLYKYLNQKTKSSKA